MTDQAQRLEIATVRAEIGSNITYRFNNDAIDAEPIPTDSGNIKNLKQVIKQIQATSGAAESYESVYLVYAPGVTFERQTQLVQRDGELYRVKEADSIPLTLTGTWSTDAPDLLAVGDAALRQALKDPSSPLLGAGITAFRWGTPYSGESVGAAIKVIRNIRQFGDLANNGVTNDLAVFQAAAAAGPGVIDARGLNCLVQGQVSIGEGQIWLLEGSKIKLGTYTGTTFWMYHAHDSALIGPYSITGTGKASGAQKAVEVNSSKRFLLYGITTFDIPGWGFYLSGNVGVTRAEGGRVINCGGHRCYKGYEDLPGSEYMTIDNPHFTQNAEFGMKTTAGNVRIINPQVLDNDKDGLLVFGGINHAHGGIVGGNINHNPQYNLHVSDVINGLSITGTNFYANNGAGQGAIFLERTKGINISDGIIDCRVYVFNAAGQNVLRDMYCPGDYGPMVIADETDKQPALLWVHNCTGAGIRRNLKNINNPGPMYTNVSRTGAVQALTVNVGTVLKFATVNRDDHAAYNVSTGVFTVPATQQGLYRIRACIVVTAPGYSPQSCYVELRIGATPVVLCASPAGFSTNVLTYNIDYEVELNAANTLSLVATISASSANFGHETYDSRLTIERIG